MLETSSTAPGLGYTWHERKSGSSAFEFGAGRVVSLASNDKWEFPKIRGTLYPTI